MNRHQMREHLSTHLRGSEREHILKEFQLMSQVAEILERAMSVIRKQSQTIQEQQSTISGLQVNQLDSTDQSTLQDAETFLGTFAATSDGGSQSSSGSANSSGSSNDTPPEAAPQVQVPVV